MAAKAKADGAAIDRAVLKVIEQQVLPDGRLFGAALEPWQREHVLGPLLARRKGLPAHSLFWAELLKGAGKSTLGAAWAVAECAVYPGTWVDVAAIDKDQAGIIGGMAAGFVERTPALRRQAKATKERIDFRNGSTIRVLSSDEPSGHGGGGRGTRYRLILDELALWPDFALAHTLLASTGKMADVQTAIFTNPGAVRATEGWRIRERVRAGKGGWRLYAPEDAIKPRWITDAWRAQMAEALPPALFERFVRGRWADGGDVYVTREQVLACVDLEWQPQERGSRSTYVACDLGLTKDRTAIAAVAWNGPRLDLLNMWVTDPAEIAGGEVQIEMVENTLLMIGANFPTRKLLLDPWGLAASRQRLQARLPVQDFPFGVSNQERVSASLYGLLSSRRLRLFDDPALVDELVSLQTVVTPKGFRFDHRRGGHNDRCAALAMACHAACEAGMPSGELVLPSIASWRDTAGLVPTGPVPHDRGDFWVSAGQPESDEDWFDRAQRGPGGAHSGGRTLW